MRGAVVPERSCVRGRRGSRGGTGGGERGLCSPRRSAFARHRHSARSLVTVRARDPSVIHVRAALPPPDTFPVLTCSVSNFVRDTQCAKTTSRHLYIENYFVN